MSTDKPTRRPRYRGKNPRHFSEKYKEHAPERYAAYVDKVIAGGKTPAGTHRPVMVREVMEVLAPQDDSIRRIFQALRIAVNDEFGALDAFLHNLPFCLKPGGRAAILTFHC